jgi:hypothetical protein
MVKAQSALRGPTIATLRAIEEVLSKARAPMSRYQIRKALGDRIGDPLLNEALDYLAEHEMVYDEGPGGKVLWIRASSDTLRRLRGA